MLHEAEVTHLPALAEGLGAFEIDVVEIAVVDDITVFLFHNKANVRRNKRHGKEPVFGRGARRFYA